MAVLGERFKPPQAGSLVHVRGRDWVVLPSEDLDVVRLRPLAGREDEAVGLFLPLEGAALKPATFAPPDPARAGDATAGLLLRDAVRLSLRSGAAPFRSLGRISVVPRPYQFVPLIMALRLARVRLLIADDVGVGKTIEAAMVARELLDRGLARRLAVLCPAHLCDQWETELREKFALEPAVIQPSRIARLERGLPRPDMSIYQYYPNLVASIDFVKGDRNRGPFLQHAPDLIIVDEAHAAARPRGTADRVQHERYQLLRALAADPSRHLVLVTATPHSGIEESFRSLLGLLNPDFDLPPQAELDRKLLVPHVVQRRRRDLARWFGPETPFPDRQPEERPYQLSDEYHQLFDDVLAYCRETVSAGAGLGRQQQRVRHWAAIALLRCLLSSPDTAVAVLAERARRQAGTPFDAPNGGKTSSGMMEAVTILADEEVDDLYRAQVLDPLEEETLGDYVPVAPLEDAEPHLSDSERRRLTQFLRRAASLTGPDHDLKLVEAAGRVEHLLAEGFHPIVFCRFIATAKYLEAWLPRLLDERFSGLRAMAVTGELGEEERRARVDELAREPLRVLVATDCLSEGINLQDHFDAVVHYDLPWNPNRLEQREGRVDRFGQRRSQVRTVLLYGANNEVDLVVLEVLVRKARAIRRQLGVAVPVPMNSEQVLQAVVDSVLLRPAARGPQLQLALDFQDPQVSQLHQAWDRAAEREDQQRAFFAQRGIQPDEVKRELEATDPILGDAAAVQRFLANTVQRFGGELRAARREGVFELLPGELRARLETRNLSFPLRLTFDRLNDRTAVYLGRTHPLVAACCDAVFGAALAPDSDERFARCGALFTDAVSLRTVVLLLRLRYLLREQVDEFAEEVVLAAFHRREGQLAWLEPPESAALELLERTRPVANMPPAEREGHVRWALDFLQVNADWHQPIVEWRVAQLQESHVRIRKLAKAPPLVVDPRTPPDLLGCYVLVPGRPAGTER